MLQTLKAMIFALAAARVSFALADRPRRRRRRASRSRSASPWRMTGPLAANGKQALLGMKIWEEEINAKGGLLGRPVKLVYYDDQSQAVDRCPASTPSCSTSTRST